MVAARALQHQRLRSSAPVPGQRPRPRRRRTQASARYFLYLVAGAALAVLVVASSVQVAVAGRALVAIKDEIKVLEGENRRLEASVTALRSLDRVERIARDRLGMNTPFQVAGTLASPKVMANAAPAAEAPAPRTVFLALAPEAGTGSGGWVVASQAGVLDAAGLGILVRPLAHLGGRIARLISP